MSNGESLSLNLSENFQSSIKRSLLITGVMGTEKSIDSEERSQFDDGLVFLEDLPPIENDSWKWLVLLVSTIQTMAVLGIFASSGIYMASIKEEFGLNSFVQIGATLSVSNMICCFLSPFAAFCIDSLGIRAASMAGMIGMGLAFISIGNIFHPSILYPDFILMAMAKSVLSSTCTVAIANYFEKKTGLALALSTVGKCVGCSTFPLLMYYLTDHVGFSTCLTIIGASLMLLSLSSMVYKPIVVVMEDEEEVQQTKTKYPKKNSKLPREISTQKSIIQNYDRKHSIVSFINQEKCPKVIALWEGENFNRNHDQIWKRASCVSLAGKSTEVCKIRTRKSTVVGLPISPFGREIMESCNDNVEQRRKSMALVVQVEDLSNTKERMTYFLTKFTSLKLLVKLDFWLLGTSICLFTIYGELIWTFFPLFSNPLLGIEKEVVPWLLAVFSVSNTIGGFLGGFVTDKKIIEVSTLVALTKCSVGILVFLFQYMPDFISLTCIISLSGLLLGSQSIFNTLILIKFYDKTALASALAILGNFRHIGRTIAPLLFTYLLDNNISGTVVWGVGSFACISSGLLLLVAKYLNHNQGREN